MVDKKNCAVSVVVTCYNYGHFVQGCLQSVFDQTFSDFEVILIDDGSTDNTEQQTQIFFSRSNFRYIKQKNAGQANAKNRGIKESHGEFIAFIDADDLWEPEKLEKQIPLFRDSEIGVVYSRQSFIDECGSPVPRGRRRRTMLPKGGKVTADLYMDNFVPFSSSIIRSKCIKELGGFDETLSMGIDWELWLRLSTKHFFDYVDEPLLVYRIGHAGQMSKNITSRQECSDRIMRNFKASYPAEVSFFLNRRAMAFTYCNRGYYFRRKDLKVSTKYFISALKQHPLWLGAYTGLFKNGLFALLAIVRSKSS